MLSDPPPLGLAPRPPRGQERQADAPRLFLSWRSWLLGGLGPMVFRTTSTGPCIGGDGVRGNSIRGATRRSSLRLAEHAFERFALLSRGKRDVIVRRAQRKTRGPAFQIDCGD